MDAQIFFQLLMALSGSTVLSVVVQSWISRRKIKVDATTAMTEVSMRQVEAMEADLAEAKREIRVFKSALYQHQRWDAHVIRRLNELGVDDVPDPPELFL